MSSPDECVRSKYRLVIIELQTKIKPDVRPRLLFRLKKIREFLPQDVNRYADVLYTDWFNKEFSIWYGNDNKYDTKSYRQFIKYAYNHSQEQYHNHYLAMCWAECAYYNFKQFEWFSRAVKKRLNKLLRRNYLTGK